MQKIPKGEHACGTEDRKYKLLSKTSWTGSKLQHQFKRHSVLGNTAVVHSMLPVVNAVCVRSAKR